MRTRRSRPTNEVVWDMIHRPTHCGWEAMTVDEIVNRFEVTTEVVIHRDPEKGKREFFRLVFERLGQFRRENRKEPAWIVLTFEQGDWLRSVKNESVEWGTDMRIWGIPTFEVRDLDQPMPFYAYVDCREVPLPVQKVGA